nr:hypothetical protein [Tanacetum cinerariifolium]
MVLAYKMGLELVEERLKFFKKNESIYLEDIKVLKFEIQMKEIAITELRRKLTIAQKEKEGTQPTMEKLENASKCLNKLIDCQIVDNCKKGLGPKAVVNAIKGNNIIAVKASACWVWKPKTKVINHVSKYNSASITLKKFDYIDAQGRSKSDQRVIDNGSSRHLTGNMSYLTDNEDIDGGYVMKKFMLLRKAKKSVRLMMDKLFEMKLELILLNSSGLLLWPKPSMGKHKYMRGVDGNKANEIASLKRRVKKLERRNKSRTHMLKRLYKVGLTAKVESLGDEQCLGDDASKQGMRIDDNKDINLVTVHDDTDKEIFDANKDLGGEEDKGKRIMVEEPLKPKKKDQIRLDEEAALKFQVEFDEEK